MANLRDYLYKRVRDYVLRRLRGRKYSIDYQRLLQPVLDVFSKYEHLKDFDPEEILKAVLEDLEEEGIIIRYEAGTINERVLFNEWREL